jgi:hypothetical protein
MKAINKSSGGKFADLSASESDSARIVPMLV